MSEQTTKNDHKIFDITLTAAKIVAAWPSQNSKVAKILQRSEGEMVMALPPLDSGFYLVELPNCHFWATFDFDIDLSINIQHYSSFELAFDCLRNKISSSGFGLD